jgi:hypothetical protein
MDVGFRASPLPLLSPSANAVKQAHVQTLPALSGQAGRKGAGPLADPLAGAGTRSGPERSGAPTGEDRHELEHGRHRHLGKHQGQRDDTRRVDDEGSVAGPRPSAAGLCHLQCWRHQSIRKNGERCGEACLHERGGRHQPVPAADPAAACRASSPPQSPPSSHSGATAKRPTTLGPIRRARVCAQTSRERDRLMAEAVTVRTGAGVIAGAAGSDRSRA